MQATGNPLRRGLICLLIVVGLTLPALGSARAQTAGIVIGTVEKLATLDPADAGDVFTWEVMSHLFTGLTRQKVGTVEYELALASQHTVSEDGLTHSFVIRPDAAFNDGTPITAQTFADTINRTLTLSGRGGKVVAQYVKTASADASTNTLTLELVKPIPFIEQLVALPIFAPLPPSLYTVNAFNNTPTTFISNGIYKVEHFEPSKSITLTADPAWKGDTPQTATITITHFDYPADLRVALINGDVDLAWRGLPDEDTDLALRTSGLRQENAPGLQSFYLLIDVTQKPFNNLIARQGTAYMFDRERAVKVGMQGMAEALYSLVPSQLEADAPAYPAYDFDKAAEVLASGKFTRYNQINSSMQYSRLLYGDLYAEGISVLNSNLQRQRTYILGVFDTEPKTFLNQIERGQFKSIIVGWSPLVPHPYAYLQPLLASDGRLAAGAHYQNAEIDTLLKQAATAEPSAQSALYQQVQTLALQDVVAVPLWQNQQTLIAHENVQGIVIEPNFLLRYDQLKKS